MFELAGSSKTLQSEENDPIKAKQTNANKHIAEAEAERSTGCWECSGNITAVRDK